MSRNLFLVPVLAAVLSLMPRVALAASPSPDATFGIAGKRALTLSAHCGSNDHVFLAASPRGKNLVATSSCYGPKLWTTLFRFTAQGRPDPTFGGDGRVKSIIAWPRFVAVDGDGRAYVGGTWTDAQGNEDSAVARYTVRGKLDRTYGGGDGVARVDLSWAGGRDDGLSAAALLADRSIAFASCPGSYGGGGAITVARLTPAGSLDSSFGKKVIYRSSPYTDPTRRECTTGMAVAANGDLLLTGRFQQNNAGPYPPIGVYVYLLSSQGVPKSSFDEDGIAELHIGAGETDRVAPMFAPDGKIVLTGSAQPGERNQFTGGFKLGSQQPFIARLLRDGHLDRSFSGDGKLFPGAPGDDVAFGARFVGSKILLSRTKNSGVFQIPAVSRITANGRLDATFARKGTLSISTKWPSSSPRVVLAPKRRFVLAARIVADRTHTLLLARYNL